MVRSQLHVAALIAIVALPVAAQERRDDRAGTSQTVLLTIVLPADAELEIVGQKMSGRGEVRRFRSPPLEPGQDFIYSFKATWKEDGKTRTVKREVTVRAGDKIEVDLHGDEVSGDEKEVFDLVNRERAAAGEAPLRINAKLCRAARGHSASMAKQNVLAHTLDGKEFWQRIDDAGYRHGEAGENIGQAARSPAEAMDLWMDSPGHRANILNPNFRELGVGVATSKSGEKFWTQVFAVPSAD